MLIIRIEKDGQTIATVTAVSDNDCQFEVEEQIYTRGKPSAVKKYGIIAHKPAEGDKSLALKMLERITGK